MSDTSQQYISLREAARLELLGAERRLALAKQSLQDFIAQHVEAIVSPDLAESLAHERNALELELDAAQRRHAECCRQFAEPEGNGHV
jgi:hypothetical protein